MRVRLYLDFQGETPKERSYHAERVWDDINEEEAHYIFAAAVYAGTNTMIEILKEKQKK